MTTRSVFSMILASTLLACGDSSSAGMDTDTDAESDSGTSTGSASETTPASAGETSSSPTSGEPTTGTNTLGDSSTTSDEDASTGSTTGDAPLVDPRIEGEHEVELIETDIETAGGTTIPVTMYVPTSEGPHPVVIFLQGFLLGPDNYASYGEHIGSWGYVVIMPELPGGTQSGDRDATTELIDWLDGPGTLEGAVLGGRADPELLLLSGHSRGGKVSFLTATTDTRVDAVFGIDPVDTAGGPGTNPSPDNPSVAPELMPLVLAPMTIVGETVNATGGFMSCAPEAENFRQYFGAATAPAAAIEFVTANHMSFLDDPNCGFTCSACTAGTDDPSVTRRMTQGYMVAFAQWQLRGQEGYRDYLAGPFTQPDIDAGLITVDTLNEY
ncbi:MAG: chlorophyllase/cutinase-like alpha/beta fold protein [Nannocystales bacterium]